MLYGAYELKRVCLLSGAGQAVFSFYESLSA